MMNPSSDMVKSGWPRVARWGWVAVLITMLGLISRELSRVPFLGGTMDQFASVLSLALIGGLASWALWCQGETRRLMRELAGRRQSGEQLRKLSRAVEQSPASIVITDRRGCIEYVNPKFCQVTGYTFEEAQGQNPRLLKSGELPPEVYVNLWKTIFSGKEWRGEFHNRRKDGRLYWESASISPVLDDGGRITHFVAVKEDITERKQAEEQLRQSQRFLQSTLDALSAHIAILDEAGVIIAVNAGWKNFAAANQLAARSFGVGTNYLTVCESAAGGDAREAAAVAAGIRAVMAKAQGMFHLEYPCHSPGEQRWFLVRVTRFSGDDQARIIVAHENITERRRTDEELLVANQRLLETSRQAGMAEVATNVLHNVGNVLNSVNVSATLLVDNARQSKAPKLGKVVALLDEHAADLGAFMTQDSKGRQVHGYLGQLAGQLAREQQGAIVELESLRKNIEHIKEIVALQQNNARVSGVTETLKMSDLVEDVLSINAEALRRHGVEITREYDEVPLVTVEKHKVLQVLINLIRNASHACADSGRTDKRLTVRIATGADCLMVVVTDNGIGIPAGHLQRIFNHGFTTRKAGHGFGLHSGALAAKEMGGELLVQSEGPGLGATFTLVLPLQTPVKTS